jgi:hypothetical protein
MTCCTSATTAHVPRCILFFAGLRHLSLAGAASSESRVEQAINYALASIYSRANNSYLLRATTAPRNAIDEDGFIEDD